MMKQNDTFEIATVFPCPVYRALRDSMLDREEEKDIKNIIEEGMNANEYNSRSLNSYIFNTKLKKLKEFCEVHIRSYVKEIIAPKDDNLDYYITQSWLNITKSGERHHQHRHSNSIISGVFYVAAVEDDQIYFDDPFERFKDIFTFEVKEHNFWNSSTWYMPVETNQLLLFPSWFPHSVAENKKQTTDRISISFNTFMKGTVGEEDNFNELILE